MLNEQITDCDRSTSWPRWVQMEDCHGEGDELSVTMISEIWWTCQWIERQLAAEWAFKVKAGADGPVERYKARLVAQGFSHKFGIDYNELFPMIRLESVRTVIALAVLNGQKLHQMDVTTAFLNGLLDQRGGVYETARSICCQLPRTICMET